MFTTAKVQLTNKIEKIFIFILYTSNIKIHKKEQPIWEFSPYKDVLINESTNFVP